MSATGADSSSRRCLTVEGGTLLSALGAMLGIVRCMRRTELSDGCDSNPQLIAHEHLESRKAFRDRDRTHPAKKDVKLLKLRAAFGDFLDRRVTDSSTARYDELLQLRAAFGDRLDRLFREVSYVIKLRVGFAIALSDSSVEYVRNIVLFELRAAFGDRLD